MKFLATLLFAMVGISAWSQTSKVTSRSILLEGLTSTHNAKNWFVPINVALEGLTAEQAKWTDGSGNHSAGQLAYHLLFWNERLLKKFKGEKEDAFSGNNEETFDQFDEKQWASVVARLDQVMSEIEGLVTKASDQQLATWASELENISTHNAYHTGQIIFVRKLQGSWNPEKGVK